MKQLTMDDFWADYEKTGAENLYFMLFKSWPQGGPLSNKGLLMLDHVIMDQTFKINDAQAKYHFPNPGMLGVLTGIIYD